MLSQLSASQLTDWEAFDRFEPFGTELENLRAGIICATIMNALSAIFHDKKKGKPQRWYPKDFFPDPMEEPKKPQTVEDMKKKLEAIAQMAGTRKQNGD